MTNHWPDLDQTAAEVAADAPFDPQYWSLHDPEDGTPLNAMRALSRGAFELYRGNGRWETFTDPTTGQRILQDGDAVPITADALDAVLAATDARLAKQR